MIQPKEKICAGCGKPKYIWKSVKGRKYCKECTYSGKIEEDTPNEKIFIKEKGFIKLKQIKKVSDKMTVKQKEYSLLRKQFLEKPENSTCAAKLPGICLGSFKQDLTVHHKKGRIGSNLLDTTTWISLCLSCHDWVETHPYEARQLGLSETKH